MTRIVLDINNCKDCPNLKIANQWSSDGWDRMEDWICSKHTENIAPIRNGRGETIGTQEGKLISGCVEWHEESKIQIPDWCPIKIS